MRSRCHWRSRAVERTPSDFARSGSEIASANGQPVAAPSATSARPETSIASLVRAAELTCASAAMLHACCIHSRAVAERAPDAELLEAARRVFRREGVAGASMERIAREAGVSRVTLHRRGVTKRDLVDGLARRALDDYRTALWPALTALGSGRDRLALALRAICASAERHRELLAALGEGRDEVFHEGDRTRAFFTDPLVRLLEDGAEDGTLRAGHAEERATVLFNLVGLTYLHLRTGHGWEEERAADTVVDLALNGVVA